MKFAQIFLALFSFVILTMTSFAQTEDAEFNQIVADFLKKYFVTNPISATTIGVHDYDSMLDDMSFTSFQLQLRGLSTIERRLGTVDLKRLSMEKHIDYQILSETIDEIYFSIEELREHTWNPLVYTEAIGNSIAGLIYQDFAPLEERLRNAIERAKQVPDFLHKAKENLSEAPRMHVETAIQQNQGNIKIFKDELTKAGSTARPEIQAEIRSAIKIAIAALEGFETFLQKSLLPKAIKNPRIGKDLFQNKLAFALKSNLTAEQLLQRALADKDRVHQEMYNLAEPLYKEYYGSPPQGLDKLTVIKKVLDKIALDHCKKDELMATIQGMIPEIERFVILNDLLTLDLTQPLVIRETPEYQRGIAVASLEAPGPLEKNLKTFYNVTPIPYDWTSEQTESYLNEYNNWSLRDLTIHEGIPGHYVQLYYSNRNPSIIRSIFTNTSMVEGWAVYAERMMIEQGFMNNDPRMKLVNLKWYIRAVLNAVIDQKVHAYDMSEQEFMALLTKEGFQEEREAAGKWRRANLTSAQLSSYFAGFQEIWDLREAYKTKMGANYSLKKFNETFLSYGSPPVKYIRTMMLEE